jgi:hypothetical protein
VHLRIKNSVVGEGNVTAAGAGETGVGMAF